LTLALGEAYISVLSGFFLDNADSRGDFLETLNRQYPLAIVDKLKKANPFSHNP